MRLAQRKCDQLRQRLRRRAGKFPAAVLRYGEVPCRCGSGRDRPGGIIEVQPAKGTQHRDLPEEPERAHRTRPPHVQPVGEGGVPSLAVPLPLGWITCRRIRGGKTERNAVQRIAQHPRVGPRLSDAYTVGARGRSGLGRFDDLILFLLTFRLGQHVVPIGLCKEFLEADVSPVWREARGCRPVGHLDRSGKCPAVSFRDEFVEIHIGRDAPVGELYLLAIPQRAFQAAEAIGLMLPTGLERGKIGQLEICVCNGGPAVRFVVAGHPQFVHPDRHVSENIFRSGIPNAGNGRVRSVANTEHDRVDATERGRSLDAEASARRGKFSDAGTERHIVNVRPVDAVCGEDPVVARYFELVQSTQFDIHRIQIDEFAAYHAAGLPEFVGVGRARDDRTGGQRHFVFVVIVRFVGAEAHEEPDIVPFLDGRPVAPFAVHMQKHAQVRIFQQVDFLVVCFEDSLLFAGHKILDPQGHGLFARVLRLSCSVADLADDRAVGRDVRSAVFLVVDA